jgi:hypothetical protein
VVSNCAAAEEQDMVEKYYVAASSGSTVYYIGLEKVGRLWYWPDGTSAGNGQPSNANPYAHWWAAYSVSCKSIARLQGYFLLQ